jgi:hypothetical protein
VITLDVRFWSKVSNLPCEPGCWLWTAALHSAGYGVFNVGGDILYAHRLAFAEANGLTYDEAEHVHHKCHVRSCCNPAHLEDLTAVEHNEHHAEERRSDFCAKGHPRADAYIRTDGTRMCRTCRRFAVVKTYTVGSRAPGRRRYGLTAVAAARGIE